jgi:ribosomal protein S18 acetylase RimI-like enzyme
MDARAHAAFAIAPARTPADLAQARSLFETYAASLGVSLCFQGFDEEVATLPGDYAEPDGGLWLARAVGASGAPVMGGCIALRMLAGDAADPAHEATAELKRLYVTPAARGTGLGRALAHVALAHARRAGYHCVKLDTLPGMDAARALYASLGFRPCAPYYRNPLDGVLYLELRL